MYYFYLAFQVFKLYFFIFNYWINESVEPQGEEGVFPAPWLKKITSMDPCFWPQAALFASCFCDIFYDTHIML